MAKHRGRRPPTTIAAKCARMCSRKCSHARIFSPVGCVAAVVEFEDHRRRVCARVNPANMRKVVKAQTQNLPNVPVRKATPGRSSCTAFRILLSHTHSNDVGAATVTAANAAAGHNDVRIAHAHDANGAQTEFTLPLSTAAPRFASVSTIRCALALAHTKPNPTAIRLLCASTHFTSTTPNPNRIVAKPPSRLQRRRVAVRSMLVGGGGAAAAAQ